jgi:hypothetical protein
VGKKLKVKYVYYSKYKTYVVNQTLYHDFKIFHVLTFNNFEVQAADFTHLNLIF